MSVKQAIKRRAPFLCACILLIVVTAFGALPCAAWTKAVDAMLQGRTVIRTDETITLTFALDGEGLLGVSGTLHYDSDQLTLCDVRQEIAAPWVVEFNGNYMVAYDNNLSDPIDSNTILFTLTFKVNGDLAVNTSVEVLFTDVTVSDGAKDVTLDTVRYKATVVEWMSTEDRLAKLGAHEVALSPAFHPDIVNYTVRVPYETTTLIVDVRAMDDTAMVEIDNPPLKPETTTTVTITVTAPEGNSRIYTIEVYREKEASYEASANNALSAISVDGYQLSPQFRADVTEYTVWLPYETSTIQVNSRSADTKASVRIEGDNELIAGQDTPVKVICTAENGNQKIYTLVVKRAAPSDDTVDKKPALSTASTTTVGSEPTPSLTTTTTDAKTQADPVRIGIPWWLLAVVGAICFVIGLSAGLLVRKN